VSGAGRATSRLPKVHNPLQNAIGPRKLCREFRQQLSRFGQVTLKW
jgi:hypothetical protein